MGTFNPVLLAQESCQGLNMKAIVLDGRLCPQWSVSYIYRVDSKGTSFIDQPLVHIRIQLGFFHLLVYDVRC